MTRLTCCTALAALAAALCLHFPAMGEEADSAETVEARESLPEPDLDRMQPQPFADSALGELQAFTGTGDLDEIVERGLLRVATVYNPLFLSYDGAEQQGLAVDFGQALQDHLRKTLGKEARKLTVVVMAFPRDDLIEAVADGRADIASANITITPERRERVAFTDPMRKGVKEILVTGPAAGEVSDFDDLIEAGITLRLSSSYAEHLAGLNAERETAGHAPIPLHLVDDRLEDYDLMQLVDAGAIAAIVIDDHKAAMWVDVLEDVTIHDDLVVSDDHAIAIALRKAAPKLLEALNGFVGTAKKGTELGNILFKRYYGNPERITNPADPKNAERVRALYAIIQKHALAYGFDPLLIASQGYQESHLDQSKRSKAGAVGIMQLLPSTARDPNVDIPDISTPEANIEAGIKYLAFLRGRYFSEPDIEEFDRELLSLAAYNAGPGNIRKARARAVEMGLDPDRWFGNVEVATARVVSREPVVYVRNILKYYTTFDTFAEQRRAVRDARTEATDE